MSEIKTVEQLRERYPEPNVKAKNKVMSALDRHAIRLIEHSHFVLLSSVDVNGLPDISPKGGQPGFVKIVDANTLLIPESNGNNRIDSLQNIVANPHVGLMFMVNGIDEVVRVKGLATLSDDMELLQRCPDGAKAPKVVIKVAVKSLYFHCAKSVMRAKLWSDDYRVERTLLPSLSEIIKEQQQLEGPYVSQEEMLEYYKSTL